jgi:hypothetical protein
LLGADFVEFFLSDCAADFGDGISGGLAAAAAGGAAFGGGAVELRVAVKLALLGGAMDFFPNVWLGY